MLHLLEIRIPIDAGNEALSDPDFGKKMHELLAEIKAQAAYFTSINGQRGAYIAVDLNDASQIPAIAEPFFLWLKADVRVMPAMKPEDLGKAGPAIAAAIKKWG
jgi:hypothetical protein